MNESDPSGIEKGDPDGRSESVETNDRARRELRFDAVENGCGYLEVHERLSEHRAGPRRRRDDRSGDGAPKRRPPA